MTKVDSYKYVLDKLKLEEARLAAEIKSLTAIKKSLVGNHDKLRELMTYHMREQGFKRLPGERYQVSLVSGNEAELSPLLHEPETEDYQKLGEAFVKRSYSWNTTAIKAAILAGDPRFEGFGRVSPKHHISITAKKDIK